MSGQMVHFDIAGALAGWADTDGKQVCTDAARAATRFKHPTGRFDSMFYSVRSTSLSSMVITVRNEDQKPKLEWVQDGTAAHNIPGAFGIPPPFGTSGRFDGRFHPGTKPNPFAQIAMDAAGDIIGPAITKVIGAVLTGDNT